MKTTNPYYQKMIDNNIKFIDDMNIKIKNILESSSSIADFGLELKKIGVYLNRDISLFYFFDNSNLKLLNILGAMPNQKSHIEYILDFENKCIELFSIEIVKKDLSIVFFNDRIYFSPKIKYKGDEKYYFSFYFSFKENNTIEYVTNYDNNILCERNVDKLSANFYNLVDLICKKDSVIGSTFLLENTKKVTKEIQQELLLEHDISYKDIIKNTTKLRFNIQNVNFSKKK